MSEVYRHPHAYAIGYRWNTEAECDFLEACLKAHGPNHPTTCGWSPEATGARGAPRTAGAPGRWWDHPHHLPEAARGGPAHHVNSLRCAATAPHAKARRGGAVTGRWWDHPTRLFDIGCGAGRHLFEFARLGYEVTGIDKTPEMVAYVAQQAAAQRVSVAVREGDLQHLRVPGPFDAAYCFMDTFRFLLTIDDVLAHLRAVAERLVPGGLYLTDFWIPRQWDQAASEIHQWEQTEGDTTVRVCYLQHPDSIDPVAQTFEDELVFEVQRDGETHTIRGGRTRTRLILPQEFALLVTQSGAFELLGVFSGFDLAQPLAAGNLSWRMVSVLRKQ